MTSEPSKKRAFHLTGRSSGISILIGASILLTMIFTDPPRAYCEQVPVTSRSGNSLVPVRLNGIVTMDFVIDTGASVVLISDDLFNLLKKSGTVRSEDLLPDETFVMANGAKQKQKRFLLQRLQIGSVTLTNVQASVGGTSASLLLGQSALKLLPGWQLDLQRDLLTFNTPKASSPPAAGAEPQPSSIQKCWHDYLNAVEDYELAKRESWLLGSLPPRMLVAQEKLGELSKQVANWPSEGDPLQSLLQKAVDRSVSMVNLSVRSLEGGESTSERLGALRTLYTEEMGKLFVACVESKLGKDRVYDIMFDILKHPVLFLNPGQKTFGVFFTELGGKIYTTLVFQDLPAAKAGLGPGALITNLDGQAPGNLSTFVKNLRSGSIHQIEFVDGNGQQKTLQIEARRFVPFGGKTGFLVNFVNLGNNSISSGVERGFRTKLARRVSNANRPDELVFTSFHTPDLAQGGSFRELASRLDGDYAVGILIDDWKIASERRVFVGTVRVCTCSAHISVYSSTTGQLVFDETVSESVDATTDKEQTFKICQDRLVESTLKQVLPLLSR